MVGYAFLGIAGAYAAAAVGFAVWYYVFKKQSGGPDDR